MCGGALVCGSFSHVEGALMFGEFLTCGGDNHMWGLLMCGGYSDVGVSHVWRGIHV